MSERRAPRIQAAVGTIVRQGSQKEPCLTRSVSTTGLALTTRMAWDQAQPVTIDIVEEGYRLRSDARVVRVNDGILSIEFDQDNPDVAPVMSALMEHLLARTGSHSNPDLSDVGNLDGKVKWTESNRKGFNLFSKRFSEGTIRDITHEGASIATRRPPELETDIVLILDYDESNESLIKVEARVVRHTDGGFAVQFESPTREVRSWISKMRSYQRLE